MNRKEWIEKRLLDITNLKDGWVSSGKAIKERAIKFTDSFFACIDDYEHWDLGPYPNGSIIITFKNGDAYASINVTEAGISAFIANDETKLYETLEAKFEDTYVLDDLLTFLKTYNII